MEFHYIRMIRHRSQDRFHCTCLFLLVHKLVGLYSHLHPLQLGSKFQFHRYNHIRRQQDIIHHRFRALGNHICRKRRSRLWRIDGGQTRLGLLLLVPLHILFRLQHIRDVAHMVRMFCCKYLHSIATRFQFLDQLLLEVVDRKDIEPIQLLTAVIVQKEVSTSSFMYC